MSLVTRAAQFIVGKLFGCVQCVESLGCWVKSLREPQIYVNIGEIIMPKLIFDVNHACNSLVFEAYCRILKIARQMKFCPIFLLDKLPQKSIKTSRKSVYKKKLI